MPLFGTNTIPLIINNSRAYNYLTTSFSELGLMFLENLLKRVTMTRPSLKER